ncbi:MAG TPA: hypothetical protein VLA89_00300 [Gemmatimonadales bacterium]|nr:hypothetical protein [Gemmatimonadales bacterium]
MPRKRARLFLAWVGEHAVIILTACLLAMIAGAVWNLYLYAELRHTRSSLTGIEIARIVEQRSQDRNQVTQCRTSIPFIRSFQVLTESVRTNLRQSATLNRRLAMSETSPALKRARLRLVALNEAKAKALVDLPNRNQAFCDKLKRDLRAELVRKYGDKLIQLEKEERQSQGDDQR